MSRKQKKICPTLNYIEHFLILASTITRCISVSDFASLIGIPVGITGSAIGLEICAITAGIQKFKSISKKKRKKHRKRVFLEKSRLNKKEILSSKALIDSVISHDQFVLINNALKLSRNERRNQKFKDLRI